MLVMLSLILFSCLHFLCKLNSPEDLLGLRRKRKAPGTKLIGPLWLPISPCTFLTVAKCHGEFWASSWVNYFSSPQPSPSLSLTSSSLLLFLILVALNLNGILCLCSVAKKKIWLPHFLNWGHTTSLRSLLRIPVGAIEFCSKWPHSDQT